LFWEYKFSDLSWKEDLDLIIGRILAEGTLAALRWLRRRAGDPALRDWLIQRRGAGLSPRHLRFYETLLELPHRQVNAWLAAPERQVWDRRRQR
jgi:hypothetical protein